MTTDAKRHRNLSASNKPGKAGNAGDPAIIPEMKASSDALRGKPSLSMIGLLLVEMIIGYEWLVSGVAKFVLGGFPSGLADELLEKSVSSPTWYSSLMKSAFIPYAEVFGYLIEIREVLAGVALIAGPFIWLCAWDRYSDQVRAGRPLLHRRRRDWRNILGVQDADLSCV